MKILNMFFRACGCMLACLLAVLLYSCSKDCHEIPGDVTDGNSALVTVTLNTDDVANKPLNDVHLYWFDESDKLYRHDYYASMQELGLAKLEMPVGSYTVFAVMNVGKDFSVASGRSSVPDIDLSSFSEYVKEHAGDYPEILTGTLRNIVKYGSQLFYIDIADDTQGMKDSSVELLLKLPSSNLPPYASALSVSPNLRATAHIFKKGSNELYATRRVMLNSTDTDGEYTMGLSLFEGGYDVNLWVDYTTDVMSDYHYVTTNPNIIRIPEKSEYSANNEYHEYHDAFSKRISLDIKDNEENKSVVEMDRPLAKYRIIATDVDKYNEMREKKDLPSLSELKVFVGYEGFFPNAYSISEHKPCDAENGYFFNTVLGTPNGGEVDVAKDFVFVNGEESSVSVTILFKDAAGNIVSGIKGVKIDYKIGQLTTVSGNFLTSGLGSGVHIETEWEGDFDVDLK